MKTNRTGVSGMDRRILAPIYVLIMNEIQDEALVIVELARKALVKAGMLSSNS
jgi:hypothetical protein